MIGLQPPIFTLEYAKKHEKIDGALIRLPTRRKPVVLLAAPSGDSNMKSISVLPLVSKIDQKMNGDGFFRSEYATGHTGSDAQLTQEAEVKPHIDAQCE
ncbi:hypothetical protein [Pseudomonas azerbaijanorientalis]|uniref:hypothetical protein n=1 Tax=Pseudomonas azerbaijanorientalis TaxID=2842350 RepID=UPI001C3D9281|nr:hypothetical protein [Pseudomonas azerbaijanorientalis]QXH64137.1 hypothetical protein KSS91_11935 [Pseudomonas azerbaijanorientalis]